MTALALKDKIAKAENLLTKNSIPETIKAKASQNISEWKKQLAQLTDAAPAKPETSTSEPVDAHVLSNQIAKAESLLSKEHIPEVIKERARKNIAEWKKELAEAGKKSQPQASTSKPKPKPMSKSKSKIKTKTTAAFRKGKLLYKGNDRMQITAVSRNVEDNDFIYFFGQENLEVCEKDLLDLVQKKKWSVQKPKAKKETKPEANAVYAVDPALSLLKRFTAVVNKEMPVSRIGNLYSDFLKAAYTRTVNKKNPHAAELQKAGDLLHNAARKTSNTTMIRMSESELLQLKVLATSEKERISVTYLKRFAGLFHTRIKDMKKSANTLHDAIRGALDKKKILKTDPYFTQIETALKKLKNKDFEINEFELNGILNGITF